MASVDIRACLLIVSLSAVVGSGCTRFDSRISGHRRNGQQHIVPDTLRVTASPSPDHDAVELPLITPEPTFDKPILPETASPEDSEFDSVLNELDATLLILEDLLGSTEHWDVVQP